MLLKCLELSNTKAKDFDMRPGLKFLTQKVGNLCKSANLYTQANTSEVVQIIVLIECCLDGIERYAIEPKNMKEILAKEEDDDKSDIKQKSERDDLGYLEIFLRKLHCKWERFVRIFIKVHVNSYIGHKTYIGYFYIHRTFLKLGKVAQVRTKKLFFVNLRYK